MKRVIVGCLVLVLLSIGLEVKAQRPGLSQLEWQQNALLPAAVGHRGGDFQFMLRQSDSLYSAFWALNVQFDKLNSAVGVHQYINQTGSGSVGISNGATYVGYVRLPKENAIRLGVQGIQHKQLTLENTTGTHAYWANASLAWTQQETTLGLSVQNVLGEAEGPRRSLQVFAGFDELMTTRWWQSSFFIHGDLNPELPKNTWRAQYSATLFNTVLAGGSLYRNDPQYAWGLHGGLKLFRRVWMTAAADFTTLEAPTAMPVHVQAGLRWRFKATERISERWQDVRYGYPDDDYSQDEIEE